MNKLSFYLNPLKNVYECGELSEDTTCANFAQVADNRKIYHYKFYSLSAIIAVGYRINSGRAARFRQWATKVLDTFTKQGYGEYAPYLFAKDQAEFVQLVRAIR